MVLYVIGLGLGDEKDITVKGLERIRSCSSLYLEYYTSVLGVDKNRLEDFYGISVTIADRNMVELEADKIYRDAKSSNVGFLVVGDPLCATTHVDLILRAKKEGVVVEVIHNTSVMGAVASCGLQLYQYGYTVSIPFFEENWKPSSFYDRIKYNQDGGMHTLCLLDIKVREPDYDTMQKFGKVKLMPPRFMTINTAINQLLEVENEKEQGVITEDSLAVGMARLGQPSQMIVFGSLRQLREIDFGPPLHSLALCARHGDVNPVEMEILETFRANSDSPKLRMEDLKGDEEEQLAGQIAMADS